MGGDLCARGTSNYRGYSVATPPRGGEGGVITRLPTSRLFAPFLFIGDSRRKRLLSRGGWKTYGSEAFREEATSLSTRKSPRFHQRSILAYSIHTSSIQILTIPSFTSARRDFGDEPRPSVAPQRAKYLHNDGFFL